MTANVLPTQKCSHCHKQTLILDKKCSECGFPGEGSKEEQDAFLAAVKKTNKRVHEIQLYVKWAISLLYFIGMLYIFIFLRLKAPWGARWVGVALGVPYIALGVIASRYKPHIIFLVALTFYLFTELILFRYILLPVSLFSQLWAKIMVISILIIGSIAAYYSDKLKAKIS